MSVMSTSLARKIAIVTANPIAISTAMTAIASSTSTCPSAVPGQAKYQKATAPTRIPLTMSSSPIMIITIDCWDSAP